jgi:hypothetical protein
MGAAALVLVVVGVALPIGVSAYRQHATLAAIEKYGGTVQIHRLGPLWLREYKWIEEYRDNFDEIESVWFRPDVATFNRRCPGAAEYYGPVPYVEEPMPTVDDAVLAWIARLPRLKRLKLAWTNVGDAGIRHAAGLTELEELRLSGTDVSDASVPLLTGLRKLKHLEVAHTRLTDNGLAVVRAALPGCKVIGGERE